MDKETLQALNILLQKQQQQSQGVTPQHYIDALKSQGGVGSKLVPHLQETFNSSQGQHPQEVFNSWAEQVHSIPSNVMATLAGGQGGENQATA